MTTCPSAAITRDLNIQIGNEYVGLLTKSASSLVKCILGYFGIRNSDVNVLMYESTVLLKSLS